VSDISDFDLSDVPSWARSVLDRELQPQESESALSYREDAVWPLLVEAAVVNTFLPQDLAPEAVKSDERSEAERVVLNFAETSRALDGGLQWSLKDETRAEVIKEIFNTTSLQQAIDRTAKVFHDAGSEALRNCLSKEPVTESLDLDSLEATRFAVSSLSHLLPDLPNIGSLNIDNLDREIEYRRLLRVFERMIGRRPNPDGTKPIERFYGRDEEMEALRDYVGVVPADSLGSRVRRGFNWLSRTISGRTPFVIWGVGGVGKTTLVSKFMLEHADAAVGRYPFSYLDFDRNTISARRPSGLLMEMCQQVGSQFDKLTQPMVDLRSQIARLARTFDVSREFEKASYLTSYTQQFRKLIDDFLASEQGTFEFARPFLLVFDTFEVVQYTADDLINLEDFAASFSYPQENRLWNRLRLIISGRKPIESFLGDVESRELGALNKAGSRSMVIDLASDAGKSVSDRQARALVAAVAKATEEPSGGVQPLRLKLIGNLFQTETDDGPTIVKSLLDELSKPLQQGGLAASILIDGILVRRVLGHIRDDRVRALADPGLVVRRITPEVIKEVMTRATTDPSQKEPEGSDAEPSPPWIVDELEAQRIFDEFGKEGSLVEPYDILQDANSAVIALRHRADVRRQMLPLIRARRPNRFGLVHQLAFDYFSRDVEAKKKEGKNEMPSAAEAIYHGLWLNQPLEEIDRLWLDAPGFDPRIDAEEFEDGSAANGYLQAKAGHKLQVNKLALLPPSIALHWIRRRSSDLLEEQRIESAISAIRSVTGEDYAAPGDDLATAAVLSRLLYRAGRWDECYGLAMKYLERSGYAELVNATPETPPGTDAMPLLSIFRTGISMPLLAPAQSHSLQSTAMLTSGVVGMLASAAGLYLSFLRIGREHAHVLRESLHVEQEPRAAPPTLGFFKAALLTLLAASVPGVPLLAGAVQDRQQRRDLLISDSLALRSATIRIQAAAPGMGSRVRWVAHSRGVLIRNTNLRSLISAIYGVSPHLIWTNQLSVDAQIHWLIAPRYDIEVIGPIRDPRRFEPYALRQPVTQLLAERFGLETYRNGKCQPPCGRYGVPMPGEPL
jgi:hypothetical protein